MKTIGIIGGMSWESSLMYYQQLNLAVKHAKGGLHSAKINLVSVDFAEIERLQHQGDWQALAEQMLAAGLSVQASGADFLLIATNTMHKVAEHVEQALSIPLLHIADATASELLKNGVKRVGLLGTQFTMQQNFYKGRLQQRGLDVLVPDDAGMALVHTIIYQELCQGKVLDSSRDVYLQEMEKLRAAGAEAIILGCTEIGLLVQQSDTTIRLYDTTAIHVAAAAQFALAD
ncbi:MULTISPECIES: aspartate/glutamate racemase family protein [unclassified Agarivorans]|uniref:aspartate/glutamate racemase family protein n=1 Tax=unclassified Agarivorans TaxID=2636026 RepID=UPI0026E18605|nr:MULTISPECIES: aspartate/glutamate racemase family protein [unclassified Agarivorans]MDO6685521.1 aspartate/glutamate racemase family protein [Agarivorans sp. 3_MG-2023]MDO6715907.1 aspartate/glutamate racemase family protein [Agarivorans sp. 2_MG-2023]